MHVRHSQIGCLNRQPLSARAHLQTTLNVGDLTAGSEWPKLRVGDWIAADVEETRVGQSVKVRERRATLGPQRLRPVEHVRDAALLVQARKGDHDYVAEGLK